LSFVSLSWSRITDKLAINWQNFSSSSTSAQVRFYNMALTTTTYVNDKNNESLAVRSTSSISKLLITWHKNYKTNPYIG